MVKVQGFLIRELLQLKKQSITQLKGRQTVRSFDGASSSLANPSRFLLRLFLTILFSYVTHRYERTV